MGCSSSDVQQEAAQQDVEMGEHESSEREEHEEGERVTPNENTAQDSEKKTGCCGSWCKTADDDIDDIPLEDAGCCFTCCESCCCSCCASACKPDIKYVGAVKVDRETFKTNVQWRMRTGFTNLNIIFTLGMYFVFLPVNIYHIISRYVECPAWSELDDLGTLKEHGWDKAEGHFEFLIANFEFLVLIMGAVLTITSHMYGCCDGFKSAARSMTTAIKHGSAFSAFYFILLLNPTTAKETLSYLISDLWNSKSWDIYILSMPCRLIKSLQVFNLKVVTTVAIIVLYLLALFTSIASVTLRVKKVEEVLSTDYGWDDFWTFDFLYDVVFNQWILGPILFLWNLQTIGSKIVKPGYKQEEYKFEVITDERGYFMAICWGLVLDADEFLVLPWKDF